jgi:hypothetical protein
MARVEIAAQHTRKRERGYFNGNLPRMQYPTFRQQQLPIGSGAVEASATHLVQHRVKRAGSRWSDLRRPIEAPQPQSRSGLLRY